MKRISLLLVAVLLLASPQAGWAADETSPKSYIATASGDNSLLDADANRTYVIHAIAVIATSTTSVNLYIYNGDNNLLGSSTNKITVDMDGIDGPMGVVLPYNEKGWFASDTKNEIVKVNLSAATPVIVLVTFSMR